MKDNIFVSVIVPVFNNPKGLKVCLSALEQQNYPKSLYEVIVVDNGSTESIEDLVNQFSQASCTSEATPGSYAARNRGISTAKGEVIAFTDSDCIPDVNWLKAGVRHLSSVPRCGIAAGSVEFFFKKPNYPTAVELYDSITFIQQKVLVEYVKCATTANLFTFKSVFEDVGVFNSKLKSGGDIEWGKRVSSSGYLIVYASDSCVFHPARHTLPQLYKKICRISGGDYDAKKLSSRESNNYSLTELKKDFFCLKPPLKRALYKARKDERLKNNKQRFTVFLFVLFDHYVRFLESKRLQLLGGSSHRE